MLTWKTCAQLSIMTSAEKEIFFDHDPPKASLLRLTLQDYTRPNSLGRYPGLNSNIVDDIELALTSGHIEFSAMLKAALQRHILDYFKGKFLLDAGISPIEARIHPDAEVCGLKMPVDSTWQKMVQELYKERPWPWDNAQAIENVENSPVALATR